MTDEKQPAGLHRHRGEQPLRRKLTVKQAADYLQISSQTLDKMRHHGDGPEFIRITARAIRYDVEAVDAWLEGRRYRAVAEYREVAA